MGMTRGIAFGSLVFYWRRPAQLWWGNRKLVDLRIGL